MSLLYSIDELVEVTVVKRPSKHIKTPYVADVLYNGKEYLAHTPSLGCCGLADAGATILVAPSTNKSSKYCWPQSCIFCYQTNFRFCKPQIDIKRSR